MSERSANSLSEVHGSVATKKRGWRGLLAFFGPAYLVSVGYMDPGNWATDIAGGSQFGYKLIWVLLMSNMIAVLLQTLSARLGIVRGLDLAQASKNAYPAWANIPLYILAEIAIIACDLAEIVGMAIGLNLLFGLPLIWGICITAADTVLLLFLLKKGMRTMEAFIIGLVAIIGVSFIVEMLIVEPVYMDVMKGFIPTGLSNEALYISIGIIGATVMPHNLYLHSSLVQTRKIERNFLGIKRAIKFNFFDTVIALNLAFFVNAAILILAAAAFYVNGMYNVAEIQDASKLLEELFGKAAPTFFAIALIAAGQSSTITGTLAGQIVMEGHLNLRIAPWLRRMITRLLAIIPALCTILFFGDEALGKLLVLSQVVLSLQLGFAVIPLIHFTSDKLQMKEFVIKTWVKILAWLSAAIIVYLNIQLVIQEITDWSAAAGENRIWIYVTVIPVTVACMLLLAYVFIHPFFKHKSKDKTQLTHGAAAPLALGTQIQYLQVGITVDFGTNDNRIIQSALQLSSQNTKFYLIHISESAASKYLKANTADKESELDKASLKDYEEQISELGYDCEAILGFGNAALEIDRIVSERKMDLLVMGAHGHRGIADLVFGTTIDAVRHTVKIPVLIVK